MSQENIIRAWKDENFRNSLSAKERAILPDNPAGLVELTDAELGVVGGMTGCKCGGMTCSLNCTENIRCEGTTKFC